MSLSWLILTSDLDLIVFGVDGVLLSWLWKIGLLFNSKISLHTRTRIKLLLLWTFKDRDDVLLIKGYSTARERDCLFLFLCTRERGDYFASLLSNTPRANAVSFISLYDRIELDELEFVLVFPWRFYTRERGIGLLFFLLFNARTRILSLLLWFHTRMRTLCLLPLAITNHTRTWLNLQSHANVASLC